MEGITLETPVEKKHIFADWRIVKFSTRYQYERAEKQTPLEERLALVKEAINTKTPLEIVYLRASDVKSRRVVQPREVGEMEYMGRKYLGMRTFCSKRNEERTFRLDRILEIAPVTKKQAGK